jgi:hypothetical protein
VTAFSVFTMDGRSSVFDGEPVAFIVQWKEAMNDTERQWPHAHMKNEQNEAEVVHFNPLTITAVSTRVR